MAKFIDLDTGLPALLNKIKTWVTSKLTAKQDTLVSGTNIKTVGGVSLLGSGDVPVSTASSSVSVLFVGNSLTQDAVSYLPLVLKEIVPNLTFKFYMWYDGGYTLTQILNKWNNSGKAEIFSVCENVTSWTNYNNSKTIANVLADYDFDIVSLEEYFNYKRENGYTNADKQVFNDIIDYLRTNYDKAFKVVSFFHRPLVKNPTTNVADLAIADEVFGLTYDGVRWQLENTISESVIPTGIAAYRAMRDTTLNGLGTFGYMSYEGTHSQEGLPCLMQAWCCAMWLLDKLGIPVSINNSQTRVTSSNYSSINVPGPNGSVVVGTTAQDRDAMDVAIRAYKEGKRLETGCISPNGIPAYKVEISGGDGTITERTVQLNAVFTPVDAEQSVVWSIVTGSGATIDSNGLVNYGGSAANATVVVSASIPGTALSVQKTLTFAVSSVATPTFIPASGSYTSQQSVTILCATDGATIYYTTDGSTPTSSSSVYSSPIPVSTNTTIKAVAIKDGESSSVATAAYIIDNTTFAVFVSNYAGSVSDATVVLTDGGGTDHAPASSVGGAYKFEVEDGTYTMSVVKEGYVTVTGTITVSPSSTSESVVIKRNLIAKAIVPNANCMGSTHNPLYATIVNSTTSQALTPGAYVSTNAANRCAIVIPRADATNPISWQQWKAGGTYDTKSNHDAAEFCSLIEWPLNCEEIEIRMTNTNYYAVIGVCNAQQGGISQMMSTWVHGGSSFVYTLNRSSYSDSVYLAFWMKYQANSNWNNSSTIESIGLTIVEK